MKISEVVGVTNLTKKAIRFYEEEGLICPGINECNNYRDYSREDIERLTRIALLRQLDISLKDIRDIIDNSNKMQEVLKNHLTILDSNISRMERSRNIIETVIESYDKGSVDPDSITEKLQLLNKYVDMDDSQREGYIKRQLIRMFPGILGRMIVIHFSHFLNEPVDTDEKEKAWLDMVNFLDGVEDIEYPEEIKMALEELPDEISQEFIQRHNEQMKSLTNPSEEVFEKQKQQVMDWVSTLEENEEVKQIYDRLAPVKLAMRNQLMSNGYYDRFVKNLEVLSRYYRDYQKSLMRLNDSLGLEYDDEGKIVCKKEM